MGVCRPLHPHSLWSLPSCPRLWACAQAGAEPGPPFPSSPAQTVIREVLPISNSTHPPHWGPGEGAWSQDHKLTWPAGGVGTH